MAPSECAERDPHVAPRPVLTTRRTNRLVGAALAALLVAACSGNADASVESVDARVFAGLDPVVVQEVLDNPIAMGKINEEPEDSRESMAQGIVRNFEVCRDAAAFYSEWLGTGEKPDLAPLPVPEDPREPSNSAWDADYGLLTAAADSGDPQLVRDWLTLVGSCGQWIPATPGDVNGPTIAEVIEGAS